MGFFAFDTFCKSPLHLTLREQGFKTLLEIKKDSFNKWKRTFVINKADLLRENFLPYLTNKSLDDEGANYLNVWCRDTLNSTNWDSLTLWRARKYCTVTLAIEFLEEDKVHLVDELDYENKKQEWAKVFRELKKNIAKEGIIKEFTDKEISIDRNVALLEDWCNNNLNRIFIKENIEVAKYARSWCVTLDSLRKN